MVDSDFGFGLVAVVAGGILSGLFTAPMRYVKDWPWEASWLMYCIYGLVSQLAQYFSYRALIGCCSDPLSMDHCLADRQGSRTGPQNDRR